MRQTVMMQMWGGRTSASSDCFCYRCGNAYLTWQALCRKYKALLEVPRVCFYFFFFPHQWQDCSPDFKAGEQGLPGFTFTWMDSSCVRPRTHALGKEQCVSAVPGDRLLLVVVSLHVCQIRSLKRVELCSLPPELRNLSSFKSFYCSAAVDC